MMTANASTTNSLKNQIEICQQQQFTGKLEAIGSDRQQWGLYFCLGRLIWATGGMHLIKRWQRLITQYCPQIDSHQPNMPTNSAELGDYHLLIDLVKQQKIKGEEAVRIIRNTVTEVLFDLLQQERLGQLTFARERQNGLQASLTLLNPQHAIAYSSQAWEQWCKAGLENISPNASVLLIQREQLQQHTSPPVYKTLLKLVDGERTLRDLALLMKQDLLLLTRLLNPYIRQGMMKLIKVGDLLPPADNQLKTAPKTPIIVSAASQSKNAPLIACIDDSPIMGQLMEHILTTAGYRFVGINDAVEALPMLLESQPDLIFLDLMMPIANGYEVCSQIRRISQFKNIPVIILTGNDGIVDRVRAKIVGSSEFLSKPIKPEKVLAVVRRYLLAIATKKVNGQF